MRKKVIAGNWKMYKVTSEAQEFIENILIKIEASEQVETIICAPYLLLPLLVEKTKDTSIKIAAQNMHFEDAGAYTGEISPVMLKDLGVDYVVLGHSERREYFAETDESVNLKVHAALKHGLKPIICVGETLAQKEAGQTNAQIEMQVSKAIAGLTADQVGQTMIAYEPVWAIGTGKTATSEEANTVCAYIRTLIATLVSTDVAEQLIIQYGGSVKPDNIVELLSQSDIDGALVGGASLEPDSFLQLIKAGAF